MYPSPSDPVQVACYRHPHNRAGVVCQRCDRPICPNCMNTASVGFHCPECTKSGKQKVYTGTTIRQLSRPVVTPVLMAINVLVLLAGREILESNNSWVFLNGALYGPWVSDGEYWRIVTSGFLHGGIIHLALNMLALFQLGGILEPALGRWRFGLVYGASLIFGSWGALLLSPDALTVGASGAIFGLMGALVILQRAQGIDLMSSPILPVLIINAVFTVSVPNISIGGHLGGFIGGVLSTYVLVEVGKRSGKKQAMGAVGLIAGLAFVACIVTATVLAPN